MISGSKTPQRPRMWIPTVRLADADVSESSSKVPVWICAPGKVHARRSGRHGIIHALVCLAGEISYTTYRGKRYVRDRRKGVRNDLSETFGANEENHEHGCKGRPAHKTFPFRFIGLSRRAN